MYYEFDNCAVLYLSQEVAASLLEEWADLLQVCAGADVLEVWTILHSIQVRAFPLADDSWASFRGKLVS